MFKKFAAVLLATSMIAGAAYAADTSNDRGFTAAAMAGDQTDQSKPTKPTKHVHKHARKHGHRIVHRKGHGAKTAIHSKGKDRKAHVVHPKKGSKTAARLPADRTDAN